MDEDTHQFRQNLVASLRTDVLQLILLPTEQCNFRCIYCYEDHAPVYMGADTIQGVKRFIEHRLGRLNVLDLSWFGGEPLLALSVIEEISAHVVAAIGSRVDLCYRAGMTTNGYLLKLPVVERLLTFGINHYQISLDGPQAAHDRLRVRANGTGSFHRIWNNLLAIRASAVPVKVLLRLHLTPQNLSVMPEFLAEVRDTFLGDDRFSALLKPVGQLGGPNDATMDVLGEQEKARLLPELEAVLLAGTRRDVFSPASDICYASRHNAFVIRANGAVCKCTVSLNDPANVVGRLLPDGLLEVDAARHKAWLRGWQSRDRATLECPAHEMPPEPAQLVQVRRADAVTEEKGPSLS